MQFGPVRIVAGGGRALVEGDRARDAVQERTRSGENPEGTYGSEPARFTEAEVLRLASSLDCVEPRPKRRTYAHGERGYSLWGTLVAEFPRVPVKCTNREPLGGSLQGYLEGLSDQRRGQVVESPLARARRGRHWAQVIRRPARLPAA